MSMQDFLTKALPWDHTGEGVVFNVHYKQALPENEKRPFYWDGMACTSLGEMVRIAKLMSQNANRDMYICMSSQSRYEEKTSKAGKPYKRALRFQENVVRLRSFFLDIDVKDKGYASQEEALGAFRLFIEAVDLPLPTLVVASGSGGFHAHWCLHASVELAVWQPLANALAYAAQKLELLCDTQCTVDSARILRVPGTLNWKTNPPSQVSLMSSGDYVTLEDMQETLEPFMGFTPAGKVNGTAVALPLPRLTAIIGESELSAGIELHQAKPPTIFQVADQCPFIKNTLETGGEDNQEPLWKLSLNIASFCEDGATAAHLLSDGHPGYTMEDTDQKFAYTDQIRKQRSLGWPSCKAIQLAGCKDCAGCPLLQYGKSPLNFIAEEKLLPITIPGSFQVPKFVVTDYWPPEYTKRPDGLLYVRSTGEDGLAREIKLCNYQISAGWVQHSPWVLHFTAVTSVGKETKVALPFPDIMGMGGARKTLSEHGLVLSDKEHKNMQDFLVGWINTLQKQKDAVVSAAPFGWSEYDTGEIEGFAYANRVWKKNGDSRATAVSDHILSEVYDPKGDFEIWKKGVKIITDQKNPSLNVILAASFAAPLMRFTGHDGMLVAARSNASGVGKTSAAYVGMSVWGHPKMSKQGLGDTGNQLFNKLGQVKVLPIYWDELQDKDTIDKFAGFVFNLTGGKERGRLTRTLKQATSGTWETLMVSCANASLIDIILQKAKTHNAGLMRIFEFECKVSQHGRIGQNEAQHFLGDLKSNYGHAGLIYAQWLGANHEQVKQDVKDMSNRLDILYKSKGGDERYWITTMSILILGARYAQDLGLIDIDHKEMHEFLEATLTSMRSFAKGSTVDLSNPLNVSNLMQQFLSEMRGRHTLITDRVFTSVGKPPANSVKVLNDMSKLDGLYVQMGRDDHIVRVSKSKLVEWLDRRTLPRFPHMQAFKETFQWKDLNGFLGSGTSFRNTYKEYVLEFSGLNFPDLWDESATPPTTGP